MTQPYLRTLGNGIKVLDALKDGPRTLAELVEETGIPRLSTYRILRTLEAHRMVAKSPDGAFRVTLRLWEFSQASLAEGQSGPAVTAGAQQLRDRWGETVHVAVYDRGEVIYIHKLDGTMPLRSYTILGGRAPARCVATGKALLAFQPEAEIERMLSEPPDQSSENAVTSPAQLSGELATVRDTLTAFNHGEWRSDIGGVASPILSPARRPIAAIGVSGPLERIFDGDCDARADSIRRAAATIAASLAGSDDLDDIWRTYGIEPIAADVAEDGAKVAG